MVRPRFTRFYTTLLIGAMLVFALPALACGGCTTVGGCGGTPTTTNGSTVTPTPAVVTINITNASAPGAFAPASLTVAQGTQIQWHNTSGATHSATSVSGPTSFDTGAIADGATSSAITLSVVGTYNYKCSFHPSMTGTIIVTGAGAPTPTASSGGAGSSPTPIGAMFHQVAGTGTDIGVGANGSVWVIGTNAVGTDNIDHGIYHWTGSTWEQAPGAAVRIAVDPNGNPWVVNSAHAIYRWTGTSFQLMPGTGTDIGVGANGSVWVIGTNSIGSDYGIYRWTSSTWQQMSGAALQISVDPNGNPWVVNSAHAIYRWT